MDEAVRRLSGELSSWFKVNWAVWGWRLGPQGADINNARGRRVLYRSQRRSISFPPMRRMAAVYDTIIMKHITGRRATRLMARTEVGLGLQPSVNGGSGADGGQGSSTYPDLRAPVRCRRGTDHKLIAIETALHRRARHPDVQPGMATAQVGRHAGEYGGRTRADTCTDA